PRYYVYKQLADGLALVRRISDGESFIAHTFETPRNRDVPLTTAQQLVQRGAGVAAANVLNHENLVSINTEVINYPLQGLGGSYDQPKRILMWDWCDGGTLEALFKNPPLRPTDGGFLPEGLIWEVALGMLRALQWLHEGIRDVYGVGPGLAFRGGRCIRLRSTTTPEADWLPILHRDIRPENIFLQQPKGIESYGAVKLGNFSNAYVSGSTGGAAPVVAMEKDSTSTVRLAQVRARRARWATEGQVLPQNERPYTIGTELYALGAILYHMMRGKALPAAEECVLCGCNHVIDPAAATNRPRCPHTCLEDVDIDQVFEPLRQQQQQRPVGRRYSAGLCNLLHLLLCLNRSGDVHASHVLDSFWSDYAWWADNTADGRLHRDLFDDIWFRKQNARRHRAEQLEAARE
ncbi:hypothetical protein B0T26DRAFT_611431, partial [Lasiosphaeria miniovina]